MHEVCYAKTSVTSRRVAKEHQMYEKKQNKKHNVTQIELCWDNDSCDLKIALNVLVMYESVDQ